MRVALHTLGCKLNYADTGAIGRSFAAGGFETVNWGAAAEVAVINTCSVTEEAERKCRQAIRKALRANPETFIIVTGCYAQLRPEEISAIEGVDLVLGTAEKGNVLHYLDALTKREETQVFVSCIDQPQDFAPSFAAGHRTRAFLKVQDGCDYSCSFCTIPSARGPSRSHTVAGAVAQAREIGQRGYHEVVLSGVNIGLFGKDTGASLLELLQALDSVQEVSRFRISSIEPNLLTDQVLAFVCAARAFQPHFHVPLQSGDDEVLGAMRRRYRRQLYADRIAAIREVLPDACVGADVIVGFPTETDRHFRNTVDFLDELDVSYLHVFTYSERPDTHAVAHFGTDVIERSIRSGRNRTLRMLSAKKRAHFYERHRGSVRPVLWEQSQDGRLLGFTDNYIRAERSANPDLEGKVECVRLEGMGEHGAVTVSDPELSLL